MSEEQVLQEATFSPNAVKYHVVLAAIICTATVVLIPFMLVILPFVYVLQTIQYRRIRCTLTTRSLKVRRGVLNVVEKTIPLDKITDLGLNQGPIMRAMDIEQIHIETAGQSSVGSSAALTGIEHGRDFRDRVLRQRDEVTDRPTRPDGAPAPLALDAGGESLQTLREIRDALVRIEQHLDRNAGA